MISVSGRTVGSRSSGSSALLLSCAVAVGPSPFIIAIVYVVVTIMYESWTPERTGRSSIPPSGRPLQPPGQPRPLPIDAARDNRKKKSTRALTAGGLSITAACRGHSCPPLNKAVSLHNKNTENTGQRLVQRAVFAGLFKTSCPRWPAESQSVVSRSSEGASPDNGGLHSLRVLI